MPTIEKAKRISGWQQLPDTGLVLITGFRGEGKSALAWYLAEEAHKRKRPVVAFDFTKAAQNALPRWVQHVDDTAGIGVLKPKRGEKGPAFLVCDEAALKVHARRAMSTENIEWTRLLAVARHKGFLVILIGQHQRQIDVGLVADADWVVMKRPSELHLRFARPELRQELEEAWEGFSNMTPTRGRQSSYVVNYHYGGRGWLRNRLPSFWSERISKAFAAVDLEEAETDAIRRRQAAARGAARNAA